MQPLNALDYLVYASVKNLAQARPSDTSGIYNYDML